VAPSSPAGRLARRLRALRDDLDTPLTQAQLAKALSRESRVAVATISSWESSTNPKLPPAERLRAYALFFCTERSMEGEPHLLEERDLKPPERERFDSLHAELVDLREAVRDGNAQRPNLGGFYTWDFDSGRITIICPEAPSDTLPPLAIETDPNYTRMYRYADLDALIELHGHLRASNPDLMVVHRLPSEIVADDMSGHLVILGGVGWNPMTRRLLTTLSHLPITQVSGTGTAGDTFEVAGEDGREFRPHWEEGEAGRQLVEDVALLARLRNPFNHSRTVSICNGVYSRGVLGAVRCLTDVAVRESNENYLSNRFPEGLFAVLMRVEVIQGEAISPDLEIPENRLYEWPPSSTVTTR
jgi:transcriptional regulator with XRE-family HTH domain